MMDPIVEPQESKVAPLLQLFRRPPAETGLCVYYTPRELRVDEKEIAAFVDRCAEQGVFGIIPRLAPAAAAITQEPSRPETSRFLEEWQGGAQTCAETSEAQTAKDEQLLRFWRRTYTVLLQKTQERGLKLAFYVEPPLERMAVRSASGREMRAKMLTRREYYVDQGKRAAVQLCPKGERQAVVAVDQRDGQRVDLREMVDEKGCLVWDVPTGNWCIQEFLCVPDSEPRVDYMSYEASASAIAAVLSLFSDILCAGKGTFAALHMTNVGFHAPNRRNWTTKFNETYVDMFGGDPAPWYSYLYEVEDADASAVKARMLACRAQLLRQGIYRALEDAASARGLRLICSANEPKLSAPSAISGDVVKNSDVSPCAVLERAYMYGINSLKIAAAGADNYGGKEVFCELFRDYCLRTEDVLLRDTIHAFGCGANRLLVHPDVALMQKAGDRTYADMVARCAALLCRGTHQCDIAMLYPVHSLHAAVSFYEMASQGFEYPNPPVDTDYTVLLNNIAAYVGQDVTLLHPDVMNECCCVEDGALVLHRGKREEMRFSVLILPAARLMHPGAARLAREFYDRGGKIIATGETLPTHAFGSGGKNADLAVRECMCAIFGEAALDPTMVLGQLHAKNERGGQAYWLYPGQTGADGCMMVAPTMLRRAVQNFAIPFHVIIPQMPRFSDISALSNPYPEFAALGLHRSIPGGGMFRCLHKVWQGCHIYYFGNATDVAFSGEVLLRGKHEERMLCDPQTGAVTSISGERVYHLGELYTKIRLFVPSAGACFVLTA